MGIEIAVGILIVLLICIVLMICMLMELGGQRIAYQYNLFAISSSGAMQGQLHLFFGFLFSSFLFALYFMARI